MHSTIPKIKENQSLDKLLTGFSSRNKSHQALHKNTEKWERTWMWVARKQGKPYETEKTPSGNQ